VTLNLLTPFLLAFAPFFGLAACIMAFVGCIVAVARALALGRRTKTQRSQGSRRNLI
jgi:hypothetical protein